MRGSAQKGPFIVGTSVSIAPIDGQGLAAGQVFMSQVSNDRGDFVVSVPPVPESYAELQATGFHYNEVTRSLSTSELTLRSIAPLGGAPSYINVLTHLTTERIRALAATGIDLTTARTTAEQELRSALPLGGATPLPAASELNLLGGDTEPNAYLFAASVLFAQAALLANPAAIDAELQQLLNTTSLDFADGSLDPMLLARLELAERSIDVSLTETAFKARLEAIGSTAAVPQLDRVIDTDGDGLTNATDRCPLQPGNVPPNQFCVQSPQFLDFAQAASEEFATAPGLPGTTALVGTSIARSNGPNPPDKFISVRWLSADGGAGPTIRLEESDGGPLLTSAQLLVQPTVDGSGDVIVGATTAGCAKAVFVGSTGVTGHLDVTCTSASHTPPLVFQVRSGEVLAFWRDSTPTFNSTWAARAPRRNAQLGSPVLICSECSPVYAISPNGDVAVAFFDLSIPSLRRGYADGGWSVPDTAPFTTLPTMTLGDSGRLLALWGPQSGSNSLIWAAHEGSSWSIPSPAFQGSAWPSLASDSNDNTIAAFVSNDQLLGSFLPSDGGSWASPTQLASTAAYPQQALMTAQSGVVLWAPPAGTLWGATRFAPGMGWGTGLVIPRASGWGQISVVDPSTFRFVWRAQDGGVSTVLLR